MLLDEIDGAPIQTVELLVRWCTAKRDEGKKKSRVHVLKRPVIAICNDLYATSLRPLRYDHYVYIRAIYFFILKITEIVILCMSY